MEQELKAVEGHLYGHYDSRGGTTFVPISDRKEADEFYLRKVFYCEDDWIEKWGTKLIEEDYMCATVLWFPADQDGKMGGDLEWSEEGHVIFHGDNTHWPPTEEDEERANFYLPGEPSGPYGLEFTPDPNHVAVLEYVPKGRKPVKFPQWSWTRWDDDACAFFYAVDWEAQSEVAQ